MLNNLIKQKKKEEEEEDALHDFCIISPLESIYAIQLNRNQKARL
jgi:hypothetical protein